MAVAVVCEKCSGYVGCEALASQLPVLTLVPFQDLFLKKYPKFLDLPDPRLRRRVLLRIAPNEVWRTTILQQRFRTIK